jgi:hypothetical protein
MYYATYGNSSRSLWEISLATSEDGLSWVPRGVVLRYIDSISWCSGYVAPTGVVELEGKIILLVIGKDISTDYCQNGLFASSDLEGVDFEPVNTEPLPCLPIVPGTWESSGIIHSDFEIVNGVAYIFYEGYDGFAYRVGRATMNESLIMSPQLMAIIVGIVAISSILALFIKRKKGREPAERRSIVLSLFKETCEEHSIFAWMLVLKKRFYYFDFALLTMTDP